MKPEDLLDSHGPSAADLEVLESIARHRRAFGALRPKGQHQTDVRERLLNRLDDMEEMVYEDGISGSALAECWREVDELEALYWQGVAEETAPAARPRVSQAVAGPWREDSAGTTPAANDAVPARRAA